MILTQLTDGFLHLERFVNDITHSSTAGYSEVKNAYQPRTGEQEFLLPFFVLPRGECTVHTAHPNKSARAFIEDENGIRFFCHPDSLGDFRGAPFRQSPSFIRVAPTSSTRTVLPLDTPELTVKTHLGKRISHFVRRLRASSVLHSVQISRDCAALVRDPRCPREFAYLPESIGVAHRGEDLGYIVREMRPQPSVDEPRMLVPLFALYSRDIKHPNDTPLLAQLIAKSGEEPLSYFERRVLDPFMKTWAYAFRTRGLLFESHAQNTLLELDEQYVPRRIVVRDFQSIPVDPIIRARNGLRTPFKKHVIGRGDYPRIIEHSLQYDRFIGRCMFRAFANFFQTVYGISEDTFYSRVRSTFRKYIPKEMEMEFFPQGYVTLAERNPEDNSYPLLYLHERPLCRPSY